MVVVPVSVSIMAVVNEEDALCIFLFLFWAVVKLFMILTFSNWNVFHTSDKCVTFIDVRASATVAIYPLPQYLFVYSSVLKFV